jgi:hypothetical protein
MICCNDPGTAGDPKWRPTAPPVRAGVALSCVRCTIRL